MSPLLLVLILVAALVLAWIASRYGSRRRGVAFGDGIFAAVVAMPFAAMSLVPVINNNDHPPPRSERWQGCEVTKLGTRYVVRPSKCQAHPASQLKPGTIDSYVDVATVTGERARVVAWAGDVDAGRPADAVLVFVRNRVVAAVRPTLPRPDLVKAFHHEQLRSAGFGIDIPASLVRTGTVRFSAVLGRRVSPLRFDCKGDVTFGC